MNKKYIIEVATNPASLKNLRDSLIEATTLPKDGVEVPELSRETKAKVKKDLATLFGVADYQAEAYKSMVQAMTQGLTDSESVEKMKNQLEQTLQFTNEIMEAMQKMGKGTDWMKQGVSFVDDFIKMRDSIETVDGLEKSVAKLTSTFEIFKDALAEINMDAFLQRFGNSTKAEAKILAKANKEIRRISESRKEELINIISENRTVDSDFADDTREDIESYYKETIKDIAGYLKELDALENQFKGRTEALYKSDKYKDLLKNLARDTYYIENLPGLNADDIGKNLKASLQEATDSVKSAGKTIQDVVDGLKNTGIELAITLPDATTNAFAEDVRKFVKKASETFKDYPIEMTLDVTSPFKKDAFRKDGEYKKLLGKQLALSEKVDKELRENLKTEDIEISEDNLKGLYNVNTNVIARNIADAFNKLYKTMTTGQALIEKTTKKWRDALEKDLTIKPKFDIDGAKATLDEDMAKLQEEFESGGEDYEHWLTIHADVDGLIDEIQSELNEKTFDVKVKAGDIEGGNIIVSADQIRFGPPPHGNGQGQLPPINGPQRPTPTPPKTETPAQPKEPAKVESPKQTKAITENSTALKEGTKAQVVLTNLLNDLKNATKVNEGRQEMSEQSIKDMQADAQENADEIESLKRSAKKAEDEWNRHAEAKRLKEEDKQIKETKRNIEKGKLNSLEKELYDLLKSGDMEAFEKRFSEIVKDFPRIREELVKTIEGIKTSKYSDEKKQYLTNKYTADIELIDQVLGKSISPTDKGKSGRRVFYDVLSAAYSYIIDDLDNQIKVLENEIEEETNRVMNFSSSHGRLISRINELEHNDAIENKEDNIEKRSGEQRLIASRIQKISKILDNDQDPVYLILNEVDDFWKAYTNNAEEARKYVEAKNAELQALEESVRGKNLDQQSAEYKEYQRKRAAIVEEKAYVDAKRKYDTWEPRRAAMHAAGFDIRGMLEEEVLDYLRNLLKNNPDLQSRLVNEKGNILSGLNIKSLKELAYFIKPVQESLGVKPITEGEYLSEQGLQAAFKEALKIADYISKAKGVINNIDGDLNPDAVEDFINYFKHIPGMADAVESARMYLNNLKDLPDELWDDEDPKTFFDQFKDAWKTMDDTSKSEFLSALNNTKARDGKNNISSVDDVNNWNDDLFKDILAGYREEASKLVDLQQNTENQQLQQILGILQRSTLLSQTRNAANKYGGHGIISALSGIQNSKLVGNNTVPRSAIHMTALSKKGKTKVYTIGNPGSKKGADQSFTWSPEQLERAFKWANVGEEIQEIIKALRNDALVGLDQLHNEIRVLQSDLTVLDGLSKITTDNPDERKKQFDKFSYNAFDGTDLERSWHGKKNVENYIKSINDVLAARLNVEIFPEALFNDVKGLRDQKKLEREIRELKEGDYSSVNGAFKGLTQKEISERVRNLISAKEQELEVLKSDNEVELNKLLEKKVQELSDLEDRIIANTQRVIAAKQQELATKQDELTLLKPFAERARQYVDTLLNNLFSSGKLKLSQGENAEDATWAKKYTYQDTEFAKHENRQETNKRESDRIREQIAKLESGDYDDETKGLLAKNLEKEENKAKERQDNLKQKVQNLETRLSNIDQQIKDGKLKEEDGNKQKEEASASLEQARNELAELEKKMQNGELKAEIEQAQKAYIQQLVDNLKSALTSIEQDSVTLDDAIQAVLALEHDMQVSKDKAAHARFEGKGKEKQVKNLEGKTKRGNAYGNAKRKYKKALFSEAYAEHKNEEIAKYGITSSEGSLAKVDNLLRRIQLAKTHGLMDTTELEEMASEYEKLDKKYHDTEDLKTLGKATEEDVKRAREELRKYRNALVDKFFNTEGWFKVTRLETQLSEEEGKAKDYIKEKQEEANQAKDKINAKRQAISVRDREDRGAVEQYTDLLYQNYIEQPKQEIRDALQREIQEMRSNPVNNQAKKDALRQNIGSDPRVRAEYQKLELEQKNDTDLAALMKKREYLQQFKDEFVNDPEFQALLQTYQQLKDQKLLHTEQAKQVIAKIQKGYKYIGEDGKTTQEFKDVEKAIADIEQKYRTRFNNFRDKILNEELAKIDAELLPDKAYSKHAVDIKNAEDERNAALARLKEEVKKDSSVIEETTRIKTELANDDKYKSLLKEYEELKKKGQENSDSGKALRSKIQNIENQYNQKILKVENKWIEEQTNRINNTFDTFVNSVVNELFDKSGTKQDYKTNLGERKKAVIDRLMNGDTANNIAPNTAFLNIVEAIKNEKGIDAISTRGKNKTLDYFKLSKELMARGIPDGLIDINDLAVIADTGIRKSDDLGKHLTKLKDLLFNKIKGIITNAMGQIEDIDAYDAEVEAEAEAAKKAADTLKRTAIEKIRNKTDRELLAEESEKSVAAHRKDAEDYDKQYEKDKAKRDEILAAHPEITEDVLNAARKGTLLRQEIAAEERKTTEAIEESNSEVESRTSSSKPVRSQSSSQSASGGYYYTGYGYGYGGVIDTSDLAKEGTLRGIYEVLNGGAPKGGWDDSVSESSKVHDNQGGTDSALAFGVKEALDLTVRSFNAKLNNVAVGVSNVVKDIGNLSYENMAILNENGRVGRYISGKENEISGDKIRGFLKRHKDKNLQIALHNHPDGMTALSPQDIMSAIAIGEESSIGAFGSIANGKITGVDFSEVSKEVGLKILNAYKDNIKASKFAELFDDKFDIKDEFKNLDDESKQKLSDALNQYLISAIKTVKLNPDDIFGQIDVASLSASAQQVVAQVAETVVEAGTQGAQDAVDTSKNASKAAGNIDLSPIYSDILSKFGFEKLSKDKRNSIKTQSLQYIDDEINAEELSEIFTNDDGKIKIISDQLFKLSANREAVINAIMESIEETADITGNMKTYVNAADDIYQYLDDVLPKVTGSIVESAGNSVVAAAASTDIKVKDNAYANDLSTIFGQVFERFKSNFSWINDEVAEQMKQFATNLLKGHIDAGKYNDVLKITDDGRVTSLSDDVYDNVDIKEQIVSIITRHLKLTFDNLNKNPLYTIDTKDVSKYVSGILPGDNETKPKEEKPVQTPIVDDKNVNNANAVADANNEAAAAADKHADSVAEVVEQGNKAAENAERRAAAESSAAESAREQAASESVITDEKKDQETSAGQQRSRIPVYEHNPDGPLYGNAQEKTLQSVYRTIREILSTLSDGIKVTSDEPDSSGSGGKKKQEEDTILSKSDSEAKLRAYLSEHYKGAAYVAGTVSDTPTGYAINASRKKDNAVAIQEAERAIAACTVGTKEWLDATKRLTLLQAEQENIIVRINSKTGEITASTSFKNIAIGAKAAVKELQNIDDIMYRLHSSGALSFDTNGEYISSYDSINEFLRSVNALNNFVDGKSQEELFDPKNNAILSNLSIAVQNYRKEVTSLLNAIDKYNGGDSQGVLGGIFGDSSQIKTTMQDAISANNKLVTSFGDLTPVYKNNQVVAYQLAYTMRVGKNEVQDMTAYLNPLTHELTIQQGAVKEVSTGWQAFFNGLKSKWVSIVQYMASITQITDMIRYVREGVQYVREIDSALTELKKVTDETDASYAKFLQNMSKTGAVIGATISDLTTMASEWARLGYSMEEAGKLAQSTAILLNVSEFQDATTASEALISTMQAFQYTADESMHVVDILNEVGNNYAVSSDGIATALQDSASALMEAGNNLEQATALVAAANRVVQDPSSVGSALRTISLRLRGTSVEVLEEMGEETDNVVESTSKLQEKLKALTGVDILTESGAYKDTYTILKEIAEVWKDIDNPMDQAAALELMAGKNRANTLAAILNNIEDLEGAYNDALHAENSALKENQAYLESIQGHIDILNNSLQTMWMNFINTDMVKWVVHLGDTLIKLADDFGLLQTAAFGFLTYLNLSSKNNFDLASIFGIHKIEEDFIKGFSIFGKDGLTGIIAKLFKENKPEAIEVPVDIEPKFEQVDMFSDEYISNIQLNNKLAELHKAQDELNKLRNTKFKDIQIPDDASEYKFGNRRISYLREILIPNKEAEIKAIEKDINDIANAAKNTIQNSFVELENGQFKISLDDFIDTESIPPANLNDIFANFGISSLDQLSGKKIDFSNFESAAEYIDGFNNALGEGQTAFLKYLPELNNADVALQAYLASLDGGQASLQGFKNFIKQHNSELKKSGIAAKAAAVGHQLLNAALSMGVTMLASFVIDLVVKGLDELITTAKEAAEAAREATIASQELKEQNKSLEDYKEQIRELRTELDNNTISESDAYDAREKLLTIQNELIDKFGLEKEGINLVTGAIMDQISAIDELSKRDAQQWLNTHKSEYLNAIEYFDSNNKGSFLDKWYEGFGATRISKYTATDDVKKLISDFALTQDHMDAWTDNLGLHNIDFKGSVEEVKEQVDDFILFLNEQETRLTKKIKNAEVSGDLDLSDTLRKNLESLQGYQKKIGTEYTNWFGSDSIYEANKAVMKEAQYQTAMAKYTDQYMDILYAQNKLAEAQVSGSSDEIKAAISNYKDAIDNAMNDADETWMDDYFNSFADGLAEQEFEINVKLNENGIQDELTNIVQASGENGLSVLDNNQILDMVDRGLNVEGAIDASEQYTDEQISGLIALQSAADNAGIEITDLIRILTNFGIISGRIVDNVSEPVTASAKTYSELSASVESYNSVMSQTDEILHDNIKTTEEYYNSLIELGISESELSQYIDKNNGYLVTNADELKKLVKKQKEEYKANIKTAKSQARLKYYKLAKDLVNTVKSTKNLTNAQRDHIKATLEEMDAVQDTISKYAMLESELLGVTNAYKKLSDAQEIDDVTDYGSKAEEMVNTLANAFNTGELGTASAEVSFEGLIPDWVVANAQSVDEAMESAYNYMKSGALSGLFDIKYDDDGKLESVQMTLDKVKAFTSALTEADTVFHGTWDEFTLDPAIKDLDDFANKIGVTKEVAFAYLTELERYDASNIFGDSTTGLLDQLMGDDFDYAMQQASQKYAKAAADMLDEYEQVNAKVDLFNRKILRDGDGNIVTLASQTFKASDFGLNGGFAFNVTPILPDGTQLENVEDYISKHLASGGKLEDMDIFLGRYETLDEAIAKAERLSELQGIYYENQIAIDELENKAVGFADAWAKTSDKLNDAREEAASLGRELAGAKDGVNESTGRTVEEIEADIKKNDQLISDLLSNLDKLKDEFGGEPTELVVGVALDEIQEDIDNFKKDLDKKPATLKAAIDEIDTTGFDNLGLTKNADGSWSGLAELDWYQALDPASKEEVTNYLNMIESEHYLNLLMGDGVPTIEDHLQTISKVLQDIAKMMDPTYTLHADTTAATNNVIEFKSWWNSLGDKVVTLYQNTVGRLFGGDNVNGTANASGNAYAGGKWGAKKTESSLVGELGPEMIVRGNRWFTVGENGAEFTQVKKGDIIFNHKQTEELLNNGHVTSRGKAYVSGTAYAGINTFTPHASSSTSSGGNSDSDDIKDDAEEIVDFIEMKLEEIEAIIEKTSNRIANFLDDTTSIKSKDELYDELIKAEKDKSEAYLKAAQKYNVQAAAALSGVPQEYQEMARNGAIEIKDFIGEDQVEIADKIQEYRDWAAKADEAENGHLEAIAAISAHRVEQLEDIATDFENIVSIAKSHSDLLQAEMDYIEESGGRLSEDYYEELKKHSQKQLDDMQAEREALQKILDDSVAAGDVIIGSDDWYSMLGTIYEVDKEIIDCKTSLEEFQNAINELYWDNFDKFIAEIEAVESELSNLYDLISDDDDIVDDMGNWTDDGITALGLLSQQMENAQYKSKQYGEAIEKLKKDYANGLYSVDEYNERLADLTDSQYDAIKSYEDAKKAIVDLNKVRVDAVKDGLQKEIDKYEELISKKKEALSEDKAAYDFQKSVQESNKNIKDIERKIAALKGNTSTSAMAERKRLEAELLKAREELQDLYYDHSVEKQQEALDKELEDYTKNKEDQMDALDEYLKKEEQVIADSFDLVTKNTKAVADTLIQISEEYGVTISDTVSTPWLNGANAIGTYEEQLDTTVSATTKNLETLKKQLEDLQTQADKTAESIVNATRSTVVETNDGQQTSIKKYAKGSKSVEYDQWALIDELGDELQIVPNSAGRLDYIKKGTGILNNTLTERLMDLAMNPSSMIENNRPVIGAPGIAATTNNITIDASVATLLHVEHLDGSNPAEVAKLVDKAWEKKMQTLNNSIKKFTR